MIHKKLLWIIKRHPVLYTTRFRLLSKNATEDEIVDLNYNQLNPISEMPEIFFSVNKEIFKDGTPESEFDKVKKICTWFFENIKGGPGLSLASDDAMKKMIEGKAGVCSDMVQVLNNFCVINDIKIREWGSTRIPFDKSYGGHSFSEVYCSHRNKWILIDIAYGLYFEDLNKNPLSVIQFFKTFLIDHTINRVTINKGQHTHKSVIDNIYFHKDVSPFLIVNYSNKLYDKYLKKWRGVIPVFLIHFAIYLTGKSYYYKFPLSSNKKFF